MASDEEWNHYNRMADVGSHIKLARAAQDQFRVSTSNTSNGDPPRGEWNTYDAAAATAMPHDEGKQHNSGGDGVDTSRGETFHDAYHSAAGYTSPRTGVVIGGGPRLDDESEHGYKREKADYLD